VEHAGIEEPLSRIAQIFIFKKVSFPHRL